jgi:hypothetical protein
MLENRNPIFDFEKPFRCQIDSEFLPHHFLGKYHEVRRRIEEQEALKRSHVAAHLPSHAMGPTQGLEPHFASFFTPTKPSLPKTYIEVLGLRSREEAPARHINTKIEIDVRRLDGWGKRPPEWPHVAPPPP